MTRKIVRGVAFLGVENRMLSPGLDEMQPFAVKDISDDTSTDFDLYIQVAGELILYAASPYKWTAAESSRLQQQGHEVLYFAKVDLAKVEAYRAISAMPPLSSAEDPGTRLVDLTGAAAELTRVLFDHPLSPAALERGRSIAEAMVKTIGFDPQSVQALGLLSRHDEYTYVHSARVAAYALAMALHLSLRDESHLLQIGLGCLFHDIGKSRIDLAVLNKSGKLTEAEWLLMRKHPEFGQSMVTETSLPYVATEIILHHHERPDGSGYPHQLKSQELMAEVRLAAFADIFDALTTNRPYQQAMSRYQALDYVKHKLLKTVDPDSFRAMVEIMGREKK
jgi:putative nucleotidyltransferase with HDIG domain